MAWVTIQQTEWAPSVEIAFDVIDNGNSYTLSYVDQSRGSDVFQVFDTLGQFPTVRARIRFISWDADPGTAAVCTGEIYLDSSALIASNPSYVLSGWDPNPVEFDLATSVVLALDNGSEGGVNSLTTEFVVEIEQPDPPPVVRIVPIKQTFQAFRGFDTPATTFIRNEFGRVDLTGMALSVALYRYGAHASGIDGYGDSFAFAKRPYAEIEATSPEPDLGIVQFTIPASLTNRRLDTGVYRVEIRAQNESLTLLAQGGILEVV